MSVRQACPDADRRPENSPDLPILKLIEIASQAGVETLPRARIAVARHAGTDNSRTSVRKACDHLLDFILRRTVGLSSASWYIQRAPTGAPGLIVDDKRSELAISISHCKHWIAVGLSQGAPIGLDIEVIRPKSRMNALSGFLGWSSDVNDVTDFWLRWTLSEAFAKQSDGSILSSADQTVMSLVARRKFSALFGNEDVTALCERIDPSLILSVVIAYSASKELSLTEVGANSICRWQPCNWP